MTTFGEFFTNLRRSAERTGKTDSACGAMDEYKDRHRTEEAIPFGREDHGWKAVSDQELSHSNFLEFSQAMSKHYARELLRVATSNSFRPTHFEWALNSAHLFHDAMMAEARKCGLDPNRLLMPAETRIQGG